MRKNVVTKWTVRGSALAAGVAMAVATGVGIADASSHTLQTARNAILAKTIVVNGKGVTVYELSGETAKPKHLLCNPGACFGFWPPVTVPSSKTRLTKTAGVPGTLSTIKRGKIVQVTLAGHPLYRFSPDANVPGAAGGNGIRSFGGTWHVVVTAGARQNTSTTTTTSTTTSTYTYTTPGY
jgi:predicted lipoprotein with Yx(FWY)xxD motif